MAFIKSHLVLLICGVASLAFISVAVLGMMSDKVEKKMQEQAGIGGQIRSLSNSPKNEACIQAEDERGSRFAEEYEETLSVARNINAREPLIDGVFPSTERLAAAFDYRDAYKRAIRQLPHGELAGGGLPTEFEIAQAEEDIAELREQEAQELAEGGGTAIDIAERVPAAGRASPAGAGTFAGGPARSAGARDKDDPRYDPLLRARINKARSIRCYIETDPASADASLQISPIWDPTVRPTVTDMWFAQVSLWVQRDVIDAVATVNNEAVRDLKPEEVYVANMPIKRIQTLRIWGYYTKDGLIAFPVLGTGAGGAQIPPNDGPTFTGRTCGNEFDVVRFSTVVVADMRSLMKLIDRLSQENFYQLVAMSYEDVGPDDADWEEGYMYGSDPVVRATLHFEGYMARDVFEKYYPAAVREALGIKGKPGKKP